MSLVDPAFESNVITLLKGIYDNVGGGLPYKIISGKMYLDETLTVLIVDELVNQTGYVIYTNVGPNAIGFTLESNTEPLNRCQLFLGPAQAVNDPTDPAFFTINYNQDFAPTWNISGFVRNAQDLSAFGSVTRPVDFEIRVYI